MSTCITVKVFKIHGVQRSQTYLQYLLVKQNKASPISLAVFILNALYKIMCCVFELQPWEHGRQGEIWANKKSLSKLDLVKKKKKDFGAHLISPRPQITAM